MRQAFGAWWLLAALLLSACSRDSGLEANAGSADGGGSCSDGRRSDRETDVDCGGGECGPCAVAKTCLLDRDCVSGACRQMVCARLSLSFAARTDLPDGEPGTAPAVADVDRDGLLDVVILRRPWRQIIYHGHGDGTFSVQQLAGLQQPEFAPAVADLDGDGWLDLVTGDYDPFQRTTSTLLLKGGAAGFVAQGESLVPTRPGSVVALASGDVNGDTRQDLVTLGDGAVRTLVQSTVGVLALSSTSPVPRAAGTVYGGLLTDLDSDGTPDLVSSGYTIMRFRGSGSGTWQPPERLYGQYVSDVLAADFDEDGRVDLMAFDPKRAQWLFRASAGSGQFTTASRVLASLSDYNRWFGVVADLDRDGHLDVAEAREQDNKLQLWVFTGDGRGGLAAPMISATDQRAFTQSASATMWSLAQGDFNRDGKPDLVVDSNNWGLIVLLNTSH